MTRRRKSINSERLCRVGGCQQLRRVGSKEGLCGLHEARAVRDVPNKFREDKRDIARRMEEHELSETHQAELAYEHRAQQFYRTQAWQTLSRLQRTREPLCQHCKANGRLRPADVADHIIELRDDWSLSMSLDNLQSLCHQCHNRKTELERRKRNERKEKNSLNSR